jgi:amino acid permease
MFKTEEPGVFQNWLSLTLLVALLCVLAPLGFVYAVARSPAFWRFLSGTILTSGVLWLLHR